MLYFAPLLIYITECKPHNMKRLVLLLLSVLGTHLCASAQLTELQQIQKLNLVYQQIRNNYVDDVALEPLVEEAIRATLKELDPHSQYLTKEEMTETRERLREPDAITNSQRSGDIGYIAVSRFSKPLAAEFYKAYRVLGDIESLVVDLRDNGGGAITSAIDLTSLFLHKGDVIVSTEGRNTNAIYDTKHDGKLCDIPVIVLINENSASASEIFAGAIQDHDRGVVVGRTSFGKGLVQRLINLKDGSGVTITVARYKTPSGRVIQRPYQMGRSDDYQRDTMRYQHPDSIRHDDAPIFKTLKLGREVYGGGGITPDIYIESDTIALTKDAIDRWFEVISPR